MKPKLAYALLPLLSAALLCGGCNYQQSGKYDQESGGYKWHSLYREDIQTVAAPIFVNRGYRRGVEFKLSTAIAKQLESHTPYKVVPRERADTILEGEITQVSVNNLSNQYHSNIPQEQLLTLTVNFTWKDLRTGQMLVERRNFEQTATYYPTLGEGEFVGDQEAAEKLAVAIVQEMQADW